MDTGQEYSPRSIRLNVAGHDVIIEPTDEQIRGPIAELFRVFAGLLELIPVDRRAIVGVSGIPGSGKSTLSALLTFLSSRVDVGRPAATVSIDGWHWPNETLSNMPAVGAGGQPVTMRDRKGSSGSYDVAGLLRGVGQLRNSYVPVRLPAYDRRLHEPVPAAVIVPPGVRLILLDGNYVLLKEDPWRAVYEQLDLAVFIDVDRKQAQDSVIARHIAGGTSRTEAVRKFENNDRLNTDVILASRENADVIVHLDEEYRLTKNEVLSDRALRARKAFGPYPPIRKSDSRPQ